MIVSEGVPRGRFVQLHHPEMFHEHEEVIIFEREDLSAHMLL